MAKTPPPRRLRPQRLVTLNPQLVEKLLDVGHATTGETALSRLIDAAVAEYVATKWKPRMHKARLDAGATEETS